MKRQMSGALMRLMQDTMDKEVEKQVTERVSVEVDK